MSAPLSLPPEFRLFGEQVLKRYGPEFTLGQTLELARTADAGELAIADGIKDWNQILQVLAALKLVVNPQTPLARIIMGPSTHISARLAKTALDEIDLNLLTFLTQFVEHQSEAKIVRRWEHVRYSLHVILIGLIAIVLLLVFGFIVSAVLPALPGRNLAQRGLPLKLLEVTAWLIALCLCLVCIGQALCCAAPESSGANSFFLMAGIGNILFPMLSFYIALGLLFNSSSSGPKVSQRLLDNGKFIVIGGGLIALMTHGQFLIGLLRISEHFGRQNMKSRIVSHMGFCLLLWIGAIALVLWASGPARQAVSQNPIFAGADQAVSERFVFADSGPGNRDKLMLSWDIFVIGLLVCCWMYLVIIKKSADIVAAALKEIKERKKIRC